MLRYGNLMILNISKIYLSSLYFAVWISSISILKVNYFLRINLLLILNFLFSSTFWDKFSSTFWDKFSSTFWDKFSSRSLIFFFKYLHSFCTLVWSIRILDVLIYFKIKKISFSWSWIVLVCCFKVFFDSSHSV